MTPGVHAAARTAPTFPAATAAGMADQGVLDALGMATSLRVEPCQVAWGRMVQMMRSEPHRLMALTVAALAMIDPRAHPDDLLAWTEQREVAS